jgi:hypothetical protein
MRCLVGLRLEKIARRAIANARTIVNINCGYGTK